MVARGEVWWYDAPGEARRPYLILTRTEAIPVLNQILAVPATSTDRGIPTEVQLDRTDGMPSACVLSLDNITIVRPSLFTDRITELGPAKMHEVCQAMKRAIACS